PIAHPLERSGSARNGRPDTTPNTRGCGRSLDGFPWLPEKRSGRPNFVHALGPTWPSGGQKAAETASCLQLLQERIFEADRRRSGLPITTLDCMKILYVANERRAAQVAGMALRHLGGDVKVAWAERFSDALMWVRANRDLTSLIVEDQVQHQSCASFISQVRGLGLTAPVIVIVPSEERDAPIAALKAGAEDYVAKGESLISELPDALRRRLQHSNGARGSVARPLHFLYLGDATLAKESFEGTERSVEITEARPGSNGALHRIAPALTAGGSAFPFDVLFVEHDAPGVDAFAILKDVGARALPIPVVFVVEWDEELAVPALKLGAIDYAVKSRDSFRALLLRLDRLLDGSAGVHAQSRLSRVHSTASSLADATARREKEEGERKALEEKLA